MGRKQAMLGVFREVLFFEKRVVFRWCFMGGKFSRLSGNFRDFIFVLLSEFFTLMDSNF